MEIEIKKLVLTVIKKWWIILLAAVVFSAGGYYYTSNHVTPLYVATTTMYVQNTSNYDGRISAGDLDSSARLVNTYIVLLQSSSVMNKVAEEVGLGYRPSQIRGMVSANSVNETEVLSVSVRNPNPQHAQQIANAIGKYAPAEIMRVIGAGSVEVIDTAELPAAPAYPNVRRSTMQWGAFGVVLALIAIVLKELLDTRIRSEEDLRRVTELPVIGVIPTTYKSKNKKRKKEKSTRAAALLSAFSGPVVNEAYRSARTNLLFKVSGKTHGRVMITSVSPAEGKTTTCANLAVSFAQADKSVLVIDCDMRSPGLHKVFSAPSGPGLSDILGGFADYDCVVETAVERLSFLPAGTVPPNPAELLVSPAYEKMLEYYSSKYDYIFVDTPPTGIFSDAVSVSGKFDGVIFVVKYAWTRIERIKHVIEQFEKVKAKLLGTIINDFTIKNYIRRFGTAQYVKYGYGYGMAETKKR